MATWEDGPEYAPIARPDHFSTPAVGPLEVLPATRPPAADSRQARPRFDDPQVPVAPLAALAPAPVEDERNPQRPFDVVASTLTATSTASAWGSAHWSEPGGAAEQAHHLGAAPVQWSGGAGPTGQWAGGAGPTGQWSGGPAPNGQWSGGPGPNGQWSGGPAALIDVGRPYPPPDYPPQGPPPGYPPPGSPQSYPPPGSPQGHPSPGTPQWFGPGPAQAPSSPDQPVTARGPLTAKGVVEMVTPGLIICLALGGIIYVLAPITLSLALWLSSRVHVARDKVKLVFRLALAAMLTVALLAAVLPGQYFSAWWGTVAGWATFFSWTALVLTVVFVHRALRQNAQPTPPARPPWG